MLPFDAFETNFVREASLIGWFHVRTNVGRPVGRICRDDRQMVRQNRMHTRNAIAKSPRQLLVASIYLCLIEAEKEGPMVGRKPTEAVKSTQAHCIDLRRRRINGAVVVTCTQPERGRFFAFQRVTPKQVLLAHHLKALKLPTFLREYDKLARQCAAEGTDYPRYLLRLAELELIERAAIRVRLRKSGYSLPNKGRNNEFWNELRDREVGS